MSSTGLYDLYRGQTPSQTLGPFFHQGLLRVRQNFQIAGLCTDERDFASDVIAPDGTAGQRLRFEGRLLDGRGQPVPDGLIEVWQADADGRYHHPLDAGTVGRAGAFTGFGRCATDEAGGYAFVTVKPGPVRGPGGGEQASHLSLVVGARGMARQAYTRAYFEGDDLSSDAVLAGVPPERRATLVASRSGERDGLSIHRFDVRLQGEGETVFFDV